MISVNNMATTTRNEEQRPSKPKRTIYLVGPHSTGKSTLAKALISHYGGGAGDNDEQGPIPVLQETARRILKLRGYTAADIESPRCSQMQMDILRAQFEAEERLLALHGTATPFISDRAGIDPVLYTMKYSPGLQDWEELCKSLEWERLLERYGDPKVSIVVLLLPHRPFLENDGTRKLPASWEEWECFGEMFQEFMRGQGIPFQRLGADCPDIRERVAKVVAWAS